MKIALYTSESEEHGAFVRSLGLTDVVCGMPADIDGVVPVEAFERRRDLFSRHELDWGVTENLTSTLYDEIMFGTPERERQLQGGDRPLSDGPLNVAACVTAMATAGYDGLVRAGTAALLATDDDWNPKGAANDLGYLRAVLQILDSQG